jgi:hypothetical protein
MGSGGKSLCGTLQIVESTIERDEVRRGYAYVRGERCVYHPDFFMLTRVEIFQRRKEGSICECVAEHICVEREVSKEALG